MSCDLYEDVSIAPEWGDEGAVNPKASLEHGEAAVGKRTVYAGPSHPHYRRMFPAWEFYRQSYESGPEYLANNLFKHPKEDPKFYGQRLSRAVVLNHTRVVADTYASLLYQSPVTRLSPSESTSELLSELWLDVDMLGSSADVFWQEAVTWAQVYGAVHVLVDRWEPEEVPATRAQERASGRRPYLRLIEPQDLVDWEMNARGELEWVAIREAANPKRRFGDKEAAGAETVRLWTREGWTLYRHVPEEKGRSSLHKIDAGTHPCAKVPLITLRLGKRIKGHHPLAGSMMGDLAPLQRRAVNLLSLIDEQLYQNVFNIMCMPESTFDRLAGLNFSVGGVIPVPDDASHMPQYLSPNLDTVTALREEVKACEREIRFASGLGRQSEDSRAAQTGISLAYQTVDKTALVRAMAGQVADTEACVYELALSWMLPDHRLAVDPPRYTIEVAPGVLEQELNDAMRFLSLVDDRNAQSEARAHLARAYLGPRLADTERLDTIIEGIRRTTAEAPTTASEVVEPPTSAVPSSGLRNFGFDAPFSG